MIRHLFLQNCLTRSFDSFLHSGNSTMFRPFVDALFASESASSFPGMPTWAGIHTKVMSYDERISAAVVVMISLTSPWFIFLDLMASRLLKESEKITICLVELALAHSRLLKIAYNSAENIEQFLVIVVLSDMFDLSTVKAHPHPLSDLEPSVNILT